MPLTRSPAALALAAVVCFAGCAPVPDSKRPATTPESLLDKFLVAVDTLDDEAVKTCFKLSTDPGKRIADLLVAAFSTIRAQRAFEEAVREKYGAAFARTRLDLGRAGPGVLLDRVRALRGRTRLRPEGELVKVEVLGPEGEPVPGFPGVMGREDGVWTFGVAPQIPGDENLCARLVDILAAFRDRYEEAREALSRSETTRDFLEAMKPIHGQMVTAAREAMILVQPDLAR
jgi:hypothetical protein